MDDLIKRQDVIDIIMGDGLYCDTYDDKVYSAERIESIPTADLSEYCDKLWKTAYERGKAVAHPKKAKWIPIKNTRLVECECGFITDRLCEYNFCPDCGARMEV